jgi:hypothetical protein
MINLNVNGSPSELAEPGNSAPAAAPRATSGTILPDGPGCAA